MKESGDNKSTLDKDQKDKENTHSKDDPKKTQASKGKGKDPTTKDQKEKLGLPLIMTDNNVTNTKPPLGHVLGNTSAASSPLELNKDINLQNPI